MFRVQLDAADLAQRRVGLVGVVHDLLEAIVRDDVQAVHGLDAGAPAVGQAQAAADRLLHQRAGVGSAQRHDGVEVGDVPALFQHVDVDDDLGRLADLLDGQQLADHLFLVGAALAAVDLDDLAAVAALEEVGGLQVRQQRPGVHRVAGDDQHEGLDLAHVVRAGVGLQLDLGGLVQAHAVAQLDALDFLGRQRLGVEVALRDDDRFLDEAVFHRAAQRVVEHDVPERHRALRGFHERGGGQLQPQHRFQLVEGAQAGRGTVAVRLVHQQHEVGQGGEVVEIALADVFRQALDARGLAAAHLGADLGDVEDVDAHAAPQVAEHGGAFLVVVAGDDDRVGEGELGDALEHVLGRVGGEVGDELVVDRQVGGEDEEVADAVRLVEVGDEGAHQPRLAHAGGQREAQRRELALEVLQRREQRLERGEQVRHVGGAALVPQQAGLFGEGPGQPGQGFLLWRPQAQAAGDGVDVALAHACVPPNRSSCVGVAAGFWAIGRFDTFRL